MVAFFIIPVSLTLSEAIMILLLVLIIYFRHNLAEFLCNVSKSLRNFRDELNDD